MAELPQEGPPTPPAPVQGPVGQGAKAEAPPWWWRWPRQVGKNVERHMLFWVMLAVSVYIFIWVPQISNIWRQLPPWGGWWVGYVVFLVPLLLFYLGSVLVVLDSP